MTPEDAANRWAEDMAASGPIDESVMADLIREMLIIDLDIRWQEATKIAEDAAARHWIDWS